METQVKTITVETTVNAPVEKAWTCFVTPGHVTEWNHASDDWHSPKAENDLKVGGKFNYRMEAKDGSFGFDFWGIYDTIKKHELIESTLGDGRKLIVRFSAEGPKTRVTEVFDAENTNPIELQRTGWQAILDNYKKHVEAEQ